MGVLALVSAHAGPSAQPPIGTIGNFPARLSAESISPNFPIFRGYRGDPPNIFFIGILIFLILAKFQNCSTNPSGRNSPFRLFFAQNRLFWGARGGPRNFFFIGIFIFLLLRSPCKNLKSYDDPFCGFRYGTKRKKEKEFC